MQSKITPEELKALLDEGGPLKIFDVRLVEDRTPVDHPIPGAEWRDPGEVARWQGELGGNEAVVVYCVYGHRVSQGVCALLREQGLRASYLEGGIEGWGEFIRSDGEKTGD